MLACVARHLLACFARHRATVHLILLQMLIASSEIILSNRHPRSAEMRLGEAGIAVVRIGKAVA